MVDVLLYQPRVINHRLAFPTEWDECTTAQLEVIARFIYQEMDPAECKAAILHHMLALDSKKLTPAILKNMDVDDLATTGLDLLNFMWQDNLRTIQPYPYLRISRFTRYAGPQSGFQNLTCGEYEQTEIIMQQYAQDKDPIHLATLAAILYRPAGTRFYTYNPKTNDYDRYAYEKMIPVFQKWPPEVLLTILLWYTGCRNMLVKVFPYVFSPGDGGEPDLMAFTNCIHGGAGEKNGQRMTIRLTLLLEFMMEMNLQAKYAKEQEEKYAKIKPR